MTGSNHP